MEIYYCYFKSSIGWIKLMEQNQQLFSVSIVDHLQSDRSSLFLIQCKKELEEYFKGKRTSFDLPFLLKGTTFQREVWNYLSKIPYGETVSYQQIANDINRPKAVRAVGNAVHNNPLLLILPCHRVIGKNGKLTGYVFGLSRKEFLLSLEKSNMTKE